MLNRRNIAPKLGYDSSNRQKYGNHPISIKFGQKPITRSLNSSVGVGPHVARDVN